MAGKASETEAKPAEAEGGEQAAPAPRLSRKMIMIALAGLVVLAGGGAGGYFFLAGKKEEKQAAPVIKPPVFFDMPDVLVNLSTTGGERTQYLKVKIVLELSDQALLAQIQPIVPRVMDTFQTFLRELRPVDLEGSAGLYRLKDEMTRRVNLAVAPSRVNAVLFKEIVVQ